MSNMQNPFEISKGKHVMLLYDKDEERAEAAAHWINQGLEDEQLCIYASVYAYNQLHISSIANLFTKIENYQVILIIIIFTLSILSHTMNLH